jgi:hypothetical protein
MRATVTNVDAPLVESHVIYASAAIYEEKGHQWQTRHCERSEAIQRGSRSRNQL